MTTITLEKINGIYMESSLSETERRRITHKAHAEMVKAKLNPQPAPQPPAGMTDEQKDKLFYNTAKGIAYTTGGFIALLFIGAKIF